jgi:PAS domain S-box-containing protein
MAVGALMRLTGTLLWYLQRVAAVHAATPQQEHIERGRRALADDLREVQTGQHGYRLTQDAQYLGPYAPAAADVPQRRDAWGRLTSDPIGRANVDRISGVVNAKLKELDNTLQRAAAHHAAMEGGGGKRLMDEFRVQTRLERLIAGMRDGLFEGEGVSTGATLWVSARFWEILGYVARDMPENLAGNTLFEMVHPDDLPRVHDAIENPTNANTTVSVEHRMRTAQGGWIWVHMRSTADVDPSGKTMRFRGSLQDISERKRTEERLVRQEALLAATSRMAGVGGWEYDTATATLVGSKTVFDICEWAAGEAPPLARALEFYPPEARETVSNAMSAAITDAKPFDFVVPFVGAKGRRRWVRSVGEPECRDGKTVRIIGAFQDVTEMREAAEALRAARDVAESASRTKSDFLANMSHEIRTPLNGVIGMTGLLLETPLNSDQREFAEIARSSGESLLALINNILDFSKIESGSLELENIDFDLRSVIDETVDAIALLAAEKQLEVLVDVDLACPQSVRGDPTRLRQILLNLLSNAVKFTETGDVTLTVSPAAAPLGRLALAVSVEDSGIGIPAEQIGKLFTPFTQADASTTRRHGGTGLGLSICRRLITAMGGTISLDSEPGRGTTFRFHLLLDPSSTQSRAAQQLTTRGPIRVLLVDDHPVNLRILTTQLRGWGAAVESAENAAEGLLRWDAMAAAGQVPQLAILDHQLPGHDGDWLGWQRRERDSAGQCKLVLLSSLASQFRSGDRSPFDRSVAKPVKGDVLFRLVSELTGGQSTPSPNETTEAAQFKGSRALLVDDNPVNQKLGERLLVRMGFEITQAWNGLQALERLQSQRFDVVLMDCQMPEMDGYEATRALRRAGSGVLDPSVPVIAMTAHAMSGDRDRCLAAGMNDYVSKPINPTQLRAVLRAVINLPPAAAGAAPDRGGAGDPAVLDLAWLTTCSAANRISWRIC